VRSAVPSAAPGSEPSGQGPQASWPDGPRPGRTSDRATVHSSSTPGTWKAALE
jgi:hypothetical protein